VVQNKAILEAMQQSVHENDM